MDQSSISRPLPLAQAALRAGGLHMQQLASSTISFLLKWILYSSTLYFFYSLLRTLRDICTLPLGFLDGLAMLVSGADVSPRADDSPIFSFVRRTATGELVPVDIFNPAPSSAPNQVLSLSGGSKFLLDGGIVSVLLTCAYLAIAYLVVADLAVRMRPAAKRAAFKRSLSQEALDQAPELMTVVVHDSLIDISEYSSTSKPASRKLSQTSTTTSVEKSPCDASPSSPTASKDTTVSALRLRRLTKSSRANVPALTLNPNAPVFTPKARNPFQTPTSSPASPNFPPTPTSALISDNSPRAIPTYVTSRPNRPANSPHVQVASPTSFNAQPVFIPVAKTLGAFVPVVVGRGAVGMVPVARRGELF